MKGKIYFWGAMALLLASCSNELDVPQREAIVEGNTPLSVNIAAESMTKALVDGSTLPASSKIGVKLVKSADGSAYDNKSYNNIYYSYTNENSWTVDPSNQILLSVTEGKAYAYYPYSELVSDFKQIPIESASDPAIQTDYMFSNEATGLNNGNPTANFTMSHAMSIVNFAIVNNSYTGAGVITAVKMSGNTASNTGTMNVEAQTVTATNAGYEFTRTATLSLADSPAGQFIVVPSGTESALNFKIVMDNQTYTATTGPLTLVSGQVYKYTLTMNSVAMSVSSVSVTPWQEESSSDPLNTILHEP